MRSLKIKIMIQDSNGKELPMYTNVIFKYKGKEYTGTYYGTDWVTPTEIRIVVDGTENKKVINGKIMNSGRVLKNYIASEIEYIEEKI